jgi:glutathione S-transferase
MGILTERDIYTKDVLNWKGVHLFHYQGSACSQKVRIFLNMKGINWQSHPINLARRENTSEWYMGINPRGLVPALVHDGLVIIESNDILSYIEERLPGPKLMPTDRESELKEWLRIEDELHYDLRNLTMRFIAPSQVFKRNKSKLEHYRRTGSGTVNGIADQAKAVELKFWESFLRNDGITNEQIRNSVGRFRESLDRLDSVLAEHDFILGDSITAADIAWFIYVYRIQLAGYPVSKLHTQVGRWRDLLLKTDGIQKELKMPIANLVIMAAWKLKNRLMRSSLCDIAPLPVAEVITT